MEFLDKQCDKIANILQQKLNEIALENYSYKVVKSIRNWNDENIPINDFPCLKVFRNSDSFSLNSFKVTSQLTAQYGVVISANYKHTPILNQVGKYIHTFISTIDEEDEDIIISRNVQPSGQLLVSRGQNDYIYGWYTYQFGVEDQTIPTELVQLFA